MIMIEGKEKMGRKEGKKTRRHCDTSFPRIRIYHFMECFFSKTPFHGRVTCHWWEGRKEEKEWWEGKKDAKQGKKKWQGRKKESMKRIKEDEVEKSE